MLARQMEVYAGFLEHTDHHVGRLVDALETSASSTTRWSTTSSATTAPQREGTLNGTLQRDVHLQRRCRPRDARVHDRARSTSSAAPTAYNHYAVGWAHAMDTPYQWTKQVASHWGGTRNGTIVHWPNGIRRKGEIRHQFHHVIDVAPTVLEAAGLPQPDLRQRHPADADARASSMAVLLRRRRGRRAARDPVLRDVLQPRHLPPGLDRGDPAQHAVGGPRASCPRSTTTSGSCTTPRRLDPGPRPRRASTPTSCAELQRLFADRGGQVQRAARWTTAASSGSTPTSPAARSSIQGNIAVPVRRHGPADRELACSNLKNKSHAVTAEIVVPETGAEGRRSSPRAAPSAAGACTPRTARSKYCYNLLRPRAATRRRRHADPRRHAPGADGVRLRRRRPRQGRHGHALRRRQARSARDGVDATVPMIFSGDETCDVGDDTGHPSATTTPPGNGAFTGRSTGSSSTPATTPRPPDHPRRPLPGRHGPPIAPATGASQALWGCCALRCCRGRSVVADSLQLGSGQNFSSRYARPGASWLCR